MELFQEALAVEEHHQIEQFSLVYLNRDLLEWIIVGKVGLLEVGPLEVVLEGELILEPEGLVRVSALLPGLVVEGQEEAGIDIVLHNNGSTS